MRLSKIKLAGFKSFVDPTTIHLKSNLVGVVGPNGSGKSNVIDAVRWVMGESSAKHLRGESMSDVIFTGSSARKPVGQASIELVFDNSLGKLGGKWAEYAEISVKRQVTRDGQSNYYLNGARCRRRDITDIFLGTGLGPRSYAIIEQGMISRLIEAKPEELRMLLEEAAGISKYKERRRETETRIRHTNDNLSRLMDLRDELDKQLEKLKRQARTAERYKELKTEEREVEGQLMAMQWRALDDETKNSERLLSQLQTGLEGEIATQRSYEAAIEGQREAHTEASDAYNEVQGRFYQQGADISSKEQAIQHAKERRQNLENDLREVNNTLAQTQAHQGADIARVDELKRQIENLEPRQQDLSEAAEASKTILDDAEAALQTWQQEWDEFSQDANRPNQVAEVERTRIATTEQQSHQLEQRYRRLQEELNSVNTHEFEQAIEHLNEQQAEGQERVDTLVADQETTQQLLNEQRETLKSANHKLNEAQQHLRENQGRTASLKALQEAALGQSQTDTVEWLSRNGLNDHKRLAQSIEVQTGWEKAVETVLGFHLDAVVVDSIADVEHALSQLPQGDIGFIAGMAADISPVANLGDLKALSTIVQSSKAIPSLLNNIFCADNLSQAIAAQSQLSANQSIVTRDGIWLGKNWLRVNQAQTESSGVLDRERQLRQLDQEQTQLQQNVDDLTAIIEDAQNELHELESKRDEIHAQRIEHEQKLSSLKAELSNKQHRLEQVISRRQTIEAECNEISQQISTNTESVQAARVELEKAVEEMDTVSQRREALAYRRDQLRGLFDEHRSKAQNDQQQLQQATLELHTAKNSLETTQRNLSRVDEQLGSLLNRQAELQGNIETALEPITQLQSELESLLNQRVEIDAQLSDTRRKMEAVDEEMRGLNEKRNDSEQKVSVARTQLDNEKMQHQTLVVKRQTIVEQMQKLNYELHSLFETLGEQASIEEWTQRLESIGQKIQRLGAINLAAIEEYAEQSERKNYLEAQFLDLTEALNTLESAIRKIDKETRARFKNTFDQVNDGIKRMFPKLFGGGQAYLELTGDDLLDTGVTVMARPPGKRISNIHLMSGGEKALTAVAMVFAIFELNPAPFCMLDEVDAPLDDANVGRFCELVKTMSATVQFIFITHNKVTMEIAEHLNGVTMHEPGVSRMVAVDVDEAVELAAV